MLAVEQIFNEISPLKTVDKLHLIEKILSSLNQSNTSIDEIWGKEVENRIDAYNKGDISAISMDNVFKKYSRS